MDTLESDAYSGDVAISNTDRKRLRDRAAGECSFPECHFRDHLQEAHIVADKATGPRGDASFTNVQLDSYDNRILLCPNHHATVDSDSSTWTVEALQAMKVEHERDVERRLGQPAVVTTQPKLGEEFWLEPGAPTFRVGPGVDKPMPETVRLTMTFGQTSGDDVRPVIEWSGANVELGEPLMMEQPQRPGTRYQKYQLKPVLARPSPPEDEVTFAIRFRWRDATREYRWKWPLYVREKGIWGMRTIAENVLEPTQRITVV